MSTRGCVAIREDDGWEGVFNHWDSYPSGLGEEVWMKLHRVGLSKFAKNLLKFEDWDDYLECPDPEDYPEYELVRHITSKNPDPLFMEWVYIIDPKERTMDILTHQCESIKGKRPNPGEPKAVGNGYYDYGHCKCRHVRVATVDLGGPEPDWNLIWDISRAISFRENSTMSEKVLERLSNPQEVPDCFICGIPMPEAVDSSELRDEIVGHERCIRKKLKELGADVEAFSVK